MRYLLLALFLPTLYIPLVSTAGTREILVDPRSKMAHSTDCSHLAPNVKHIEVSSVDEVERLGYRICPICFGGPPAVDDYEAERLLGIETAAKVRYYYAPCYSDSVQELVREAGRRVLDNWPYERVGYKYTFAAVESDVINAIACPTGFVFVTTGLLDCLEYPGELDFVLAHEIAHVEERHGLAQLRSAEAMAIIGGFLAGLVGAATESPEIGTVVAAMSEVASTIVLLGYSRGYENEADLVATRTYDSMHDNRDDALMFLSKVQDIVSSAGSGMFASHPDIRLRTHRVSTVEFSGGEAEFSGDDMLMTIHDVATIPSCEDSLDYEGEIRMIADVSGDLPGWVSSQRSATVAAYLGDISLRVSHIDRLTKDHYKLLLTASGYVDPRSADTFVIGTKGTGVRRRIELVRQ